jgi:perosamine synthetase
MTTVPSATISVADPILDGNEARYVLDCIQSGWLSSYGSYVDRFEADFAAFCSVPDAVSCTNATAALHMALLALGVAPDDEVIVPALTYIATANAVRYCGARPVFTDVDRGTMTLDPAEVARRITPRTKAIVTVHLYGQCADMDAVLHIADQRHIPLIEDAAQAHGAEFRGRRAGSMGSAGAFSFFGNKIVTTGEGGMLTLSDPELAREVRLLRNQGSVGPGSYWHTTVGFNYRMTNLQAAVGVAQLERVAEFLARRSLVARWYDEELGEMGELVQRPEDRPGDRRVYWMYPITLRSSAGRSRDEILDRLRRDGIETKPGFYPVYYMAPYREWRLRCPVSEDVGARGLCLPAHSQVSREQVSYIAARLRFHLGP